MRETYHFEESGVDRRIILKLILNTGTAGMDWIDLVQYTDRWRAPENVVMNIRVPYS
jgi:hypothetical protein